MATGITFSLFPVVMAGLAVDGTIGGVWAAALGTCACLLYAAPAWRIAVVADPDELIIRNKWRTVRVRWDEPHRWTTARPWWSIVASVSGGYCWGLVRNDDPDDVAFAVPILATIGVPGDDPTLGPLLRHTPPSRRPPHP